MMRERDPRFETTLRTMLADEAPEKASPELRRRVLTGVARTPQRGRWLRFPDWRSGSRHLATAIAAGVAAVVVVMLAAGLIVSGPPIHPGIASPSPVSPAPAGSSPLVMSPPPGRSGSAPTPYPVTALIPGGSNFPVLAAGSVWAPRFGTGDVVRFDPQTNEIIARIGISDPLKERGPHAIAVRDNEVWVNADTEQQGWAVIRIDPATNEVVERIPVGVPGWGMAIVDDTLWMTSWERNRVLRVDLASGEIEAEITLVDPLGIAASEDDVWVALGGRGNVARIDPATNEYTLVETGTETTTLPMLIGDEVWVTTLYSQEIVIISPDTNEVVERIRTQAPMGIAEHDGLAWVTDSFMDADARHYDDRLIAIDIASREVVRELPMTGLDVDRGIAVAGTTVWVVTTDGVARLDFNP